MVSEIHSFGDRVVMAGVILTVSVVTLLILLLAQRLARLLGQTGANVVSRLLGLVLSALAVQFILDGVRQGFAQ
jgi:multiple antibiotic resistance protein